MQGGYNTGRDVSIDINTPYGPLRLKKLMNFKSKPKVTNIEIVPLNGETDELQLYKGWTGSFDAERVDSALDDWQAQAEDDYYNGVNRDPATITEVITEVGGGITTWRYTHVILTMENAGDKAGDKTINQSMAFTARRRRKV
jgi:hypothetical protein